MQCKKNLIGLHGSETHGLLSERWDTMPRQDVTKTVYSHDGQSGK